jgi:hypothetical protein
MFRLASSSGRLILRWGASAPTGKSTRNERMESMQYDAPRRAPGAFRCVACPGLRAAARRATTRGVTCSLCLREATLRRSHILPRWAYKRLRSRGRLPDPVLFADGIAVATSIQLAEYLLCGDCETRLAVFDEYVAKLTSGPSDRSPLLTALGVQPIGDNQIARLDRLDTSKLAAFALAVVYRAHAARAVPKVGLGPYADAVRRYLMGQDGPPEHVHVVMNFYHELARPLYDRGRFTRLIVEPQSNRADGNLVHWFLVCGLKFEVTVGKCQPPPGITRFCLLRGDPKLAWVLDPYETGFAKLLKDGTARSKPKGRLRELRRAAQDTK